MLYPDRQSPVVIFPVGQDSGARCLTAILTIGIDLIITQVFDALIRALPVRSRGTPGQTCESEHFADDRCTPATHC